MDASIGKTSCVMRILMSRMIQSRTYCTLPSRGNRCDHWKCEHHGSLRSAMLIRYSVMLAVEGLYAVQSNGRQQGLYSQGWQVINVSMSRSEASAGSALVTHP